jgi:hypothetical protein
VEAACLGCVDSAMDQDARIGDGEFEEVIGQNMPVLSRFRNDIVVGPRLRDARLQGSKGPGRRLSSCQPHV